MLEHSTIHHVLFIKRDPPSVPLIAKSSGLNGGNSHLQIAREKVVRTAAVLPFDAMRSFKAPSSSSPVAAKVWFGQDTMWKVHNLDSIAAGQS